jgi:hypothetical protein
VPQQQQQQQHYGREKDTSEYIEAQRRDLPVQHDELRSSKRDDVSDEGVHAQPVIADKQAIG